MVQLAPMTESEARGFLGQSREEYADALVRAGDATSREAALAHLPGVDDLLPRHVDTPDAFLWHLEDALTGERVGSLWFVVRDEFGGRVGFVQDLLIFAPCRRRGHGRAALRALEGEARRLGLSRLALNVFASNGPARALYEQMGYGEQSIVMAKSLDHGVDRLPGGVEGADGPEVRPPLARESPSDS